MARIAGKTRVVMQEFLARATERKIDRLSDLITESFRFLLRKQTMVERIHIDPSTFAITLYNEAGHALPKERLSEGEKQIFAISVLWGLARASAHPLPAIIDTPMARLDAAHRRHLVERYFPHASHQVLILSTDTEVDRHYYQALQPHIARAYHLCYDEDTRATHGEEGYFWQETPDEQPGEESGMSIKQVRLSTQAKEQLIRLKTRTGIAHWNVLCRWAFCLSLRQPSPPARSTIPADSNVEMTWQVFGGDAHEIYLALLKERCERDGLGTSDDVLARQFRLHLHRGHRLPGRPAVDPLDRRPDRSSPSSRRKHLAKTSSVKVRCSGLSTGAQERRKGHAKQSVTGMGVASGTSTVTIRNHLPSFRKTRSDCFLALVNCSALILADQDRDHQPPVQRPEVDPVETDEPHDARVEGDRGILAERPAGSSCPACTPHRRGGSRGWPSAPPDRTGRESRGRRGFWSEPLLVTWRSNNFPGRPVGAPR